jgi:hypothetical protein
LGLSPGSIVVTPTKAGLNATSPLLVVVTPTKAGLNATSPLLVIPTEAGANATASGGTRFSLFHPQTRAAKPYGVSVTTPNPRSHNIQRRNRLRQSLEP